MKKNHPQPSSLVDELKKRFEQQHVENSNPEALYAKVNKPQKRQSSPELTETIYAPQRPPEGAYEAPSNSRVAIKSSPKLVDPYKVVSLETGEVEFEQLQNPLYKAFGESAQDNRHAPEQEEHLYAEPNFAPNGRSPQKPVESVYATANMGARGGEDSPKIENPLYEGIDSKRTPSPPRSPKNEFTTSLLKNGDFQQNRETSHLDALYAKVHTPPKRQPSPEPTETIYAPQTPYQVPLEETAYAPQKPIGNPYDRPSGTPRNGQHAKKLVDPYKVVSLETGETEFERRTNPLYDAFGENTQRSSFAPEPEEHLYAEIDPKTQGGRSPQKPVETIYATANMAAQGGEDSQKMENPLYEGISSGRTTPPPRSPKDQLTTSLLKNVRFQENVEEVQRWCEIVYGNKHALNVPLAKVLDDPKNAENILWKLAENPEGSARLAGRTVFGIKSPDRRTAEDGFNSLFSAFEKHVHVTQKLYKDWTREQERDQRHESPERDPEHRHRHHHHHRRHARGHSPDSPERSPQRQNHEENKGMAYAM